MGCMYLWGNKIFSMVRIVEERPKVAVIKITKVGRTWRQGTLTQTS